MNFAIVGATGNVGRKTIDILEKSKLKIDNLFLVASKKVLGKKYLLKKKKLKLTR
jgi:aspartate-semialdehyde dehydrogenase